MPKIEIYTKSWCPFCRIAKRRLAARELRFDEIDVTTDSLREVEMVRRSGRRTVPQIFANGHHIGGSDDLAYADETGLLDAVLNDGAKGEAA